LKPIHGYYAAKLGNSFLPPIIDKSRLWHSKILWIIYATGYQFTTVC
jgi:hypothetical protein